jgi:hydrogenase maturation factor HypF (carbamoyltransferase family)
MTNVKNKVQTLSNCPFCGSKVKFIRGIGLYIECIRCSKCKAEIMFYNSKNGFIRKENLLIKKFNRRVK